MIRYAVEATNNVRVSDATWNALKAFLDTRRLMELVQNVAFYNMVVRVLVPVGVELEPGTTRNSCATWSRRSTSSSASRESASTTFAITG